MSQTYMTAAQKLKWKIILRGYELVRETGDKVLEIYHIPTDEITAQTVDELFSRLRDSRNNPIKKFMTTAFHEIHNSGEKTQFPIRFSSYMRDPYYLYSEVVAEMPDGSWVGWTHCLEPNRNGQVRWIDEAYYVQRKIIIKECNEFSLSNKVRDKAFVSYDQTSRIGKNFSSLKV